MPSMFNSSVSTLIVLASSMLATTSCAVEGFDAVDPDEGEASEVDISEVEEALVSCPIGWYDGANCQMGTAPPGSQGFVYNGQLYYTALVTPDYCPQAGTWWDGAHCFVPHPAGTSVFIYNDNLYYNYYSPANHCPQAGSWDDGAHCFVPRPAGSGIFIYNGNLYYWMPSCPVAGSFWDGAHCKMPDVPAGTTPFVWQNVNLDYTPVQLPPASGKMVVKVRDPWGSPRQNVSVHIGNLTAKTNSQGTACLPAPWNTYVNVIAGPVTATCKTSNLSCGPTPDCYISY